MPEPPPLARGITELDLHQAADDLVAGGERPTVERIRAHLGTGSPNTVTRHLDTCRSNVGARLRQRTLVQGRPGVPAAVDALAQRCWGVALEAASEQAHAALASERGALEGAQAVWEAQRLDQAQAWTQLQQQLAQAEQQARRHGAAAAALREQLHSSPHGPRTCSASATEPLPVTTAWMNSWRP